MRASIPRSALLATATALALLAGDARAGVLLKVVNAGRTFTLEFEGNKLRVEEQGAPRVLVFDGDDGRYLEIDQQARTWAMATRNDVMAAGKALDAEIRKGIAAANPEEVRAWIERRNRMRHRADVLKRTKFEQRGGQSLIADQMCDGFDEVVAGEVVSWGCYVTWSKKRFQREDFAAVTRLAEFLNSGFGQVEAAQGIDLRDGPLGRLSRAPGLPLFRLDLRDGGKSGVPMRVEAVERQKLAADRFTPPPDYTALPERAALVRPAKAALPLEPGPGAAKPPGK
jgi:hypothetical protein